MTPACRIFAYVTKVKVAAGSKTFGSVDITAIPTFEQGIYLAPELTVSTAIARNMSIGPFLQGILRLPVSFTFTTHVL